jgi:hypothetical protein
MIFSVRAEGAHLKSAGLAGSRHPLFRIML